MRLTTCLWRGKRVYTDQTLMLYNKAWKNKGSRMVVDRLLVPAKLFDDDVDVAPIQNARNTLSDQFTFKLNVQDKQKPMIDEQNERINRRLMELDPDLFSSNKNDCNKPPRLIHRDNLKFSFGLSQAAILANAEIILNSPPIYKGLIQKLADSSLSVDPDHFMRGWVERAILTCHRWHTDEALLPKRYDPEFKHKHNTKEYGVHPIKASSLLSQSLFNLLDTHLSDVVDSIQSSLPANIMSRLDKKKRCILRDRNVRTHYKFGGHHIHFNHSHPCLISANSPCAQFQDKNSLDVPSISLNIEDCRQELGPVEPTIDFAETVNYDTGHSDGWEKSFTPCPHVHTFFVNYGLPDTYSDFIQPETERPLVSQRHSVAVMHGLASCLASARRLYGNSYVDDAFAGKIDPVLPKPIAVEVIGTDGVMFDFICFQLNTLNFEKNSDCYNQAWIDGNVPLFMKIIKRDVALHHAKFRNLNMSVFSRLTAAFLRGMLEEDDLKVSS